MMPRRGVAFVLGPRVILCLLGMAMGAQGTYALTLEEARERCREEVGRPIVQSCMRSGGGDREACRAKASPSVKACVQKTMAAAHGRANVPVALPAEKIDPQVLLAAPAATFVAPPRSISDITAILDSEHPDPAKISELKDKADAPAPAGIAKADLAWFYYQRGNARSQLGRIKDALDDASKAIEVGRGAIDANRLGRLQQFAGLQHSFAGNPRQALAIFQAQVRDTNVKGAKGFLFGAYRQIGGILLGMGDIDQADAYLRRSHALLQEARTSGMPGWRTSYAQRGQSWEADYEDHRASIFEARGQFREAEAAYRLVEQRRRASLSGVLNQKNAPPESQVLRGVDFAVVSQARMKARQGRLAEAEADARRALLARLKDQGKYNSTTPRFIMGLANILSEQGRHADAETLMRAAIEISREIGVADDSGWAVGFRSQLANVLILQRKHAEAAQIYAAIDKAIAAWEPRLREPLELNGMRIISLYASGQVEAGIAAAQALVKRQMSRVGEAHLDTAAARGTLAIGYARAGRHLEAVQEFKAAIPLFVTAVREGGDDDSSALVASRSLRLQAMAEAYIGLLAANPTGAADVASETFSLADSIRAKSVQQALTASSARMSAKDPVLAALIREEQDLAKQVNAQIGVLNNALTLPSGERDEVAVKALNAAIAKARSERDKARTEIARRFPTYTDLIDPRPPTVEGVRQVLREDEALLSFYFGRERSFVWAFSKHGPVHFAQIALTAGDLETMVRNVHQTLNANVRTIGEIPSYDLAGAYELYRQLLEPVEKGWRSAKSLIVVTNGALGLLPVSLLPTAAASVPKDEEPLFSSYRNVAWLARTHAVVMVPSVAALRSLRHQPPGSRDREPIIGFGDPFFSGEQAAEAAQPTIETASLQTATAAGTRGLPFRRRASVRTGQVDTADLAQLPRLPDTADELRSIALSLNTDPAKVLNLGKDANERKVKETDLSRFRVVAFATHGLVPGDLDGLTQPALALTAPHVADVDGDGLLTMEEVLPLRLDADWVVLSACNTAAGAVSGAEAVSGLGRAFFYAGSRSLLVTNWAVHSDSARELVTDIFRRHAADPKLSRAEALRQAMVALMDAPGYRGRGGEVLFAYAHPLFWAPYSLIGDGGGQ